MAQEKRPIGLEEGWSTMQVQCDLSRWYPRRSDARSAPSRAQDGVTKLVRILEGEKEEQFNAEQYMGLYT